MENVKRIFALAVMLPAATFAQETVGNGLSYDYVGIGYTQIRMDTTFRASMHGTAIEGSKLINDEFFVQGTYFDTSTDNVRFLGRSLNINVDFKQYQLSLGYRKPLQPGTDLIATAGFAHASTRVARGASATDTIYPVSLGVKSRLTNDIEGSAEGILADGDFAYLLNMQYKISDLYAVGGYLRHDKNSDVYALTVRFLF